MKIKLQVEGRPEELISIAEKKIIEYMYKYCNYNQTQTAKALGISRNTLRTKLKQNKGTTDDYMEMINDEFKWY